ncbi:MAG: hypothetical protein OEX08_02940 [Candidatus Nomurabacteria bacterium]|nr:hypothetical protein [Candidatus Nomurabacteria bacterium]
MDENKKLIGVIVDKTKATKTYGGVVPAFGAGSMVWPENQKKFRNRMRYSSPDNSSALFLVFSMLFCVLVMMGLVAAWFYLGSL